jgi:hypothetical protein
MIADITGHKVVGKRDNGRGLGRSGETRLVTKRLAIPSTSFENAGELWSKDDNRMIV